MRALTKVVTVSVLFATAFALAAAFSAPTYTDPEEAGIDFALQGEYLGEVNTAEGRQRVGAQVIALGEGKFRIVAYVGGLPGDGWSRGDEKHMAEAELAGDSVTFVGEHEGVQAVLTKGKVTILNNGNDMGQLPKVDRKSPTLGAKAPAEATVLFDGENTSAWKNAQLVKGKYLGATGAYTKEKFGDHRLHIEFRTPFMPESRGQARGNSGAYVQSRYEVQVLDSFGLAGADNECGGIYRVAEPAVNMCFPPLSWQTYDIDFTAARYNQDGEKMKNARITVRQNGVVIHDHLDLPHATPGRHDEGGEPDALFLQDHGNPVVYRNIWAVEK